MPTAENYCDPFECYSCGLPDSECICDSHEWGDYRPPDYDMGEYRGDDDVWECAFGADCVNPHYFHQRADCYTADMAQSYQDDN